LVLDTGLGVFDTSLAGLVLAAVVVDLDLGFDFTGFLASPITVFLTAPLLVVVVFFVVTDFLAAVAFFVVAAAFLGAPGDFLVDVVVSLTVFALEVVRALALGGARTVTLDFLAGALAAGAFDLVITVFAVAGFLAMGCVFSLVASGRDLGASLTLPEGPLGRRKMPFSLPDVIARLS